MRAKQDELLNDKQKIGLKHYEDILKRIPRKEILQYEKELNKIFQKVKNKNSTFQIVGSFEEENQILVISIFVLVIPMMMLKFSTDF